MSFEYFGKFGITIKKEYAEKNIKSILKRIKEVINLEYKEEEIKFNREKETKKDSNSYKSENKEGELLIVGLDSKENNIRLYFKINKEEYSTEEALERNKQIIDKLAEICRQFIVEKVTGHFIVKGRFFNNIEIEPISVHVDYLKYGGNLPEPPNKKWSDGNFIEKIRDKIFQVVPDGK